MKTLFLTFMMIIVSNQAIAQKQQYLDINQPVHFEGPNRLDYSYMYPGMTIKTECLYLRPYLKRTNAPATKQNFELEYFAGQILALEDDNRMKPKIINNALVYKIKRLHTYIGVATFLSKAYFRSISQVIKLNTIGNDPVYILLSRGECPSSSIL